MKYILKIMLLLGASVSLVAQEQRSEAPLRNAEVQVTAHYATVRSLSRPAARTFFRELAPEMQADLWTIHIDRFVRAHPELNDEQRGLAYEAIGMIASGFPEWIGGSSEEAAREQAVLQRFRTRALAAFPYELAQEAFSQLGKYVKVGETPIGRGEPRLRVAPHWPEPPCDCSMSSDFCDQATNPTGYRCKADPCVTDTWGCGWFWWQACTGLCGEDPPPGG